MQIFIIYTDGNYYIETLCINKIELNKVNVFIPNIGETFIDKVRNIEYEVKDVIRSINAQNEYGVQVFLKKRTERKYKLK